MIEFFIPSTPVAQGRPRFSNRGGFNKAYDPPKSRDYKSWVRTCALQAMELSGAKRFERDIPLCLRLEIGLQRPKTLQKRYTMPTKKPDCSNVQKGIEDALESICYEADQQITHVTVQKRYGEPGVHVRLWEDKL